MTEIRKGQFDESKAVPLILKQGEASLHHAKLIHGSPANTSTVASAADAAPLTMRLARQSIIAGLVLSGIAMIFAAFGYIRPTEGALLQEAIDVAVIMNALRASWS